MLTLIIIVFVLLLVSFRSVRIANNLWQDWPQWQKRRARFVIGLNMALLLLTIYTAWPFSPWGHALARQTTDQFLSELRATNHESALAMIEGYQKEEFVTPLLEPNNRPVSWELDGFNARVQNVLGKVTFADGSNLTTAISLDWYWFQWKIDGVVFGEPILDEKPKVRFWLYPNGIPFSAFRDLLIWLDVLSILISWTFFAKPIIRKKFVSV